MAKFDSKFERGKQTWETPQWLFDELNQEFNFTLDVCADEKNYKCASYISEEEDALELPWHGVCWMNPPYGNVGNWIRKAYQESRHDCMVVCLIQARTNTNWWHEYCMKASEIRFIQGRPKFGNNKHGLPQPLAVVIFDSRENLIIGNLDARGK